MKHLRFVSGILLIISISMGGRAAENQACPWNIRALSVAPKVTEDPQRSTSDVRAIFYEGVPWKGHPTRVFAYYGLPEMKGKEKVPAMVLVHGGGGSAFIPWVRLWVSRGYAAIAMDTCGCVSSGAFSGPHPRHEYGGPPGWGGFDQIDQPIEDQWTYHAVAAVILANSLVRSLPHVDPNRIGLTGVSWGGYLVCIVAGVDHRFRFAAPVYGCGFLGHDSVWLGEFRKMGEDKASKWVGLWDPAAYLPRVRVPMLWVDGTNDFAYPLDSLQRSYRLPQSPRTLCVRVRMPHGHGGPGENPKEIQAMAESLLRKGMPLARIDKSGREGLDAWVVFKTKAPITKAELNYTTDMGQWQTRKWETIPATLDAKGGKVSARLPKGTTVYYFNLLDNRDLVVSSEHEELLLNKANGGGVQ
ncbi:MAG: acetylxylan esterase [Terriglobia bacterium]|jgi:dienelactone hydrolase